METQNRQHMSHMESIIQKIATLQSKVVLFDTQKSTFEANLHRALAYSDALKSKYSSAQQVSYKTGHRYYHSQSGSIRIRLLALTSQPKPPWHGISTKLIPLLPSVVTETFSNLLIKILIFKCLCYNQADQN